MSHKKNKIIKRIYLDHAATTAVRPEVLKAMLPYFSRISGNPSALHTDGRGAKAALDAARQTVGKIINADPEEIIFTGSGTESDNLAILGVAGFYKATGRHLITSNIEHHAVLYPMEHLAKRSGFKITTVAVEKNGLVDAKKILAGMTPETILISVMYANNEIGTIQPIKQIVRLIKQWKVEHGRGPAEPPFFHTDACQAAGYLDLDVKRLGVDLMTLNGGKIYGPKGVGALFVRRGIGLEPLVFGGGQENGLRSGTENLAGIVGFAKALELAQQARQKESARLSSLRDYFFSQILEKITKVFINGDPQGRLPNNVNVSILDIEGEAALLYLDEMGVSASTGSACDSSRLEPSHVILALGRPYEYAHGSLRFTLGKDTTKRQIDYAVKALQKTVEKLRKISPLNIKIK
ncbi:MAG: cysteine desulfurase family protein [Patescibacteria group bacterium]|nr:cysteine desulfurase family protein [Patescibacteria group bacterium]